jgi:fatty acid desaturase
MEAIKVHRSWIGAVPGWLANPTLWLLALSATLGAVGIAGYRNGSLVDGVVVLVNAVGIYLSFTVLHDAMHGTAHEDRWVNAVLGRVAAIPLSQNYHLIHHLWTTIPWYRYQAVFAEIHGALAARGCRIGWSVKPLPAGVPHIPPPLA